MTRKELNNIHEPPRYSRAWWLARGRNALWVSIVTVLVWIYADVEFTDEMELQAVIQLSTPPDSVLLSERQVTVSFKVQGRRNALERLEHRLQMPNAVIRHALSEGDSQIATRDMLNGAQIIQSEGLTVLSASPSAVQVRLDKKIHVPDLPIKFEYSEAFPSEIKLAPEKMGIQVAKSDWEALKKVEPNPTLRTVTVPLKSVQSDKPFPAEIIRKIGDVTVEPDRPRVMVTVKIAQLTETKDLVVPVQVVSPTAWLEDGTWRQYVLTRKNPPEWRAKIQVSGTRKDLDRLAEGDVQAYIVLTEEDKKPVSWLTREAIVHLPRELNLSLLGARPSVTFKLEKLPATTPP